MNNIIIDKLQFFNYYNRKSKQDNILILKNGEIEFMGNAIASLNPGQNYLISRYRGYESNNAGIKKGFTRNPFSTN